jgi:hypothetical protein
VPELRGPDDASLFDDDLDDSDGSHSGGSGPGAAGHGGAGAPGKRKAGAFTGEALAFIGYTFRRGGLATAAAATGETRPVGTLPLSGVCVRACKQHAAVRAALC